TAPQTPAEYAAELFDRACIAEVSGDPAQALKLFAAAVKLDGQARYLRRAAVCALSAGELRAAEDYAKKAAALDGSDPSTARILGKVLHQLGKLESAEEVLVMALAMKSENDTLMKELAADLRAVRADLVR
ncbi:MAG: tetratricopeptide repeat protein, partial [Kofleriaceae bacterium]